MSKRKNKGEGGRKRARPKGSSLALPPQRGAPTTTKEGLNLAFIPLTTIGPSEGVQFYLFKITPEASRGNHDQSFVTSSTMASKGKQGHAIETQKLFI